MPIFRLIGTKWMASQKLVQSIDVQAPLTKVLPLISRKLGIPSMKNFNIYICEGTETFKPAFQLNVEQTLKEQGVDFLNQHKALYIAPKDEVVELLSTSSTTSTSQAPSPTAMSFSMKPVEQTTEQPQQQQQQPSPASTSTVSLASSNSSPSSATLYKLYLAPPGSNSNDNNKSYNSNTVDIDSLPSQVCNENQPLLMVLPLIARKLGIQGMKNYKVYSCHTTNNNINSQTPTIFPAKQLDIEESLRFQGVEAGSVLYICGTDNLPQDLSYTNPTTTENNNNDVLKETTEYQVGETQDGSGEAIMGRDRGSAGGGLELDFAAAGDSGIGNNNNNEEEDDEEAKAAAAAIKIQSMTRQHQAKAQLEQLKKEKQLQEEEEERKRMEEKRQEDAAALKIQCAIRQKKAKEEFEELKKEQQQQQKLRQTSPPLVPPSSSIQNQQLPHSADDIINSRQSSQSTTNNINNNNTLPPVYNNNNSFGDNNNNRNLASQSSVIYGSGIFFPTRTAPNSLLRSGSGNNNNSRSQSGNFSQQNTNNTNNNPHTPQTPNRAASLYVKSATLERELEGERARAETAMAASSQNRLTAAMQTFLVAEVEARFRKVVISERDARVEIALHMVHSAQWAMASSSSSSNNSSRVKAIQQQNQNPKSILPPSSPQPQQQQEPSEADLDYFETMRAAQERQRELTSKLEGENIKLRRELAEARHSIQQQQQQLEMDQHQLEEYHQQHMQTQHQLLLLSSQNNNNNNVIGGATTTPGGTATVGPVVGLVGFASPISPSVNHQRKVSPNKNEHDDDEIDNMNDIRDQLESLRQVATREEGQLSSLKQRLSELTKLYHGALEARDVAVQEREEMRSMLQEMETSCALEVQRVRRAAQGEIMAMQRALTVVDRDRTSKALSVGDTIARISSTTSSNTTTARNNIKTTTTTSHSSSTVNNIKPRYPTLSSITNPMTITSITSPNNNNRQQQHQQQHVGGGMNRSPAMTSTSTTSMMNTNNQRQQQSQHQSQQTMTNNNTSAMSHNNSTTSFDHYQHQHQINNIAENNNTNNYNNHNSNGYAPTPLGMNTSYNNNAGGFGFSSQSSQNNNNTETESQISSSHHHLPTNRPIPKSSYEDGQAELRSLYERFVTTDGNNNVIMPMRGNYYR